MGKKDKKGESPCCGLHEFLMQEGLFPCAQLVNSELRVDGEPIIVITEDARRRFEKNLNALLNDEGGNEKMLRSTLENMELNQKALKIRVLLLQRLHLNTEMMQKLGEGNPIYSRLGELTFVFEGNVLKITLDDGKQVVGEVVFSNDGCELIDGIKKDCSMEGYALLAYVTYEYCKDELFQFAKRGYPKEYTPFVVVPEELQAA